MTILTATEYKTALQGATTLYAFVRTDKRTGRINFYQPVGSSNYKRIDLKIQNLEEAQDRVQDALSVFLREFRQSITHLLPKITHSAGGRKIEIMYIAKNSDGPDDSAIGGFSFTLGTDGTFQELEAAIQNAARKAGIRKVTIDGR